MGEQWCADDSKCRNGFAGDEPKLHHPEDRTRQDKAAVNERSGVCSSGLAESEG